MDEPLARTEVVVALKPPVHHKTSNPNQQDIQDRRKHQR